MQFRMFIWQMRSALPDKYGETLLPIMNIHIGCSGYNYKEWKNIFYPGDIPRSRWLEYYSRHFNTVEINSTFYSFPKVENLQKWIGETPDGFKFSIKANRYFTHLKKLNTDDPFLERLHEFNEIINKAREKVDCILWQLPGNLHKKVSKLRSFCTTLDRTVNHVIEFRHPSWFDEAVYDVLRDEGVAWCMISAPNGLPEDTVTTGNTGYLRFHGKTKWYDYLYTDAELEEWKYRLDSLTGIEHLYIYFNNDQHGNAVKNARKLNHLFNQ